MLHALLLAGWVLMQPAPGSAIVTPPQEVHVTNTTVVQVPPRDPQALSDDAAIVNQSLFVNTVQPVPVEWTNALCQLPNLWTTTPANLTYDNADLMDEADLIRKAAFGVIGLGVLGIGLSRMFGQPLQPGRLLFASIMSMGNTVWWQWGIGLNNALTGVVSPPDVCGSLIRPHIQLQKPDVGSAIGAPALIIVYAVVSLFVLLGLLFRMGLIDVLIAAGSLGLICWCTEQSEYIAKWYTGIAVGTVFGQVLFTIGLRAAHNLASIGAGLGATILAIVVLLVCRKLLGALDSAHQRHERGSSGFGLALAMLARRLILKVA